MKAGLRNSAEAGAPPKPTIEFFFDFISPYGWFAAERIGAMAKRFNRQVNWRPFLLRVSVGKIMKATPPLELPLKGSYLLHDIKRTARYYGLVISNKARFGFDSVPASRALTWARSLEGRSMSDLTLALYRAHWAQGRDISDEKTILDVLEESGFCRDGAANVLAGKAIKDAFRDEVEGAIDLGVFGSPTFIVDGEPFWGVDRMPMLEAWLEHNGW